MCLGCWGRGIDPTQLNSSLLGKGSRVAKRNTVHNKKLSYRRETAHQLPTWRGLSPPVHSPSPLWLHAVIILAPQDPGGKQKKPGGLGWRRPWRAREREPITGVWGLCPQRGPGAEPLVRGAKPPWSWKLFSFWTSNESDKICLLTSWNYPQPARIIIIVSGDNLHFEGGKLVFLRYGGTVAWMKHRMRPIACVEVLYMQYMT